MNNILKSHHPIRHAKSFKYAWDGIFHALVNEANFRVQVAIVSTCIILGILFKIGHIEWAILTLSMGLMLAAEILNTVVEEVVDNLIKEYHEGAKIIKDLAAGFVLITAITALIIMTLIFSPGITKLFHL